MMETWKKTLLEWINGLELHKLIKSLDDLQNGVFFRELLKILSLHDKSINCNDDHIFKSLFKFVKYAYPDYELSENDFVVHSTDELVCICSLLMHHCAINAEEKMLRERMCHRLSMETQERITCFMQSILKHDGRVTKNVITNAIEESCKEPTLSQEIPSTECFSPRRNSLLPLTSFIQSPAARRQRDLEQRTREMRLLKAQLDTERDEKIDLQDEIKTLEVKLEKLVKEMDKKNMIILNLKSQLAEIENKYQTPIKKCTDNTAKLRSNLHKAEDRIEELQNELYEKQQQFNSLTYKLTTCQQQCSELKEKISQYDQDNNQLGKLTEMQTEQLQNLYSQNKELREMVEEYRLTQRSDHLKMNTSDTGVCSTPCLTAEQETILPLYIELELKEKEKIESENMKLKRDIEELKLEFANQLSEIQELTNNMCLIKETHLFELKNLTTESTKSITDLERINTGLKVELENIKTNFSQELIESKNFNAVLQGKLHDTEMLIENLCTQVENLQKEIISNKVLYESEQENLKMDSNNKISHLECNIAELKRINEETIVSLKDIEDSKNKLIDQLAEKSQMVLSLQDELNVKESNITDFEQRVNELLSKNDELQKFVNETKEYFEVTESDLNKKIIEIEGTNTELQNELSDARANVEELKVKLCEKETCVTGLNDINVDLNKQVEELQKNLEDLKLNHEVQIEKINSEFCEKIIELNNVKECITKELQQVSNDLTSESSKVKNLLDKQTMLKKETENELLNVSKELADLKIQMKTMSKTLQDEKTLREETENKLHEELEKTSVMCDLQYKIESLQEKYSKLLICKNDLSVQANEFRLKSEQLGTENKKLQATITLLEEKEQKPNLELITLRNAYEKVMSENSQLRLDCKVLRKTISERDDTISEVSVLKEAYEKLYKENYDLKNEVETLQNKCSKDRDEFKKAYERVKADVNVKGGVDNQIKELRTEYEVKLERMKTKMKQLCNDEILKVEKKKDLENKNICKQHAEKINKYEEYIENLRSQLWAVGDKLLTEQKDREWLKTQLCVIKPLIKPSIEYDNRDSIALHELNKISVPLDSLFGSRDSVHNVGQEQNVNCIKREPVAFFINRVPQATKLDEPLRRNKVAPENRNGKSSTLPKQFKQPTNIDDDSQTVLKKRNRNPPIDQGLHMEDEEGYVFNNTYLADLQAGRCNVREQGHFSRLSTASSSSRLSELQYRNSLCPPHLKSSYPAETQFHSPKQFTDDDLKMGIDYSKASLLPEEKPRRKDIGTTSYKKPGPPTPSKNGGRLSLQGNEREVLREHNENVLTQRKTTPSRLKALFMGRNTSTKDNSEVRKYGNLRSTCRSFHSFSHLLKAPINCPVPIKINPQFTHKSSRIYVWSSLLFILVLITCITCVDVAFMSGAR